MRSVWSHQPRPIPMLVRCLSGVALVLAAALTLAACGSGGSAEPCVTYTGFGVACGTAAPPPSADPASLPAAYINLSPSPLSETPHPYITGKIVIVNKAEIGGGDSVIPGRFNGTVPWQIDQDGSGQILAEISNGTAEGDSVAHPEEVGTVVWMECTETPVATYNNGTTGYLTGCTATVIDKAKNLIVGKQYYGMEPPRQMGCSGVGCDRREYGGLNIEYFAHYLEGLPRNPISTPTGPTG